MGGVRRSPCLADKRCAASEAAATVKQSRDLIHTWVEQRRASRACLNRLPERLTMRWEDYRMSENVDDRRGDGGYGGGGGTGVGISGGGLGIGTLVVLGLLGWALGVDPRLLISGAEMMGAGRGPSSSYSEPQRQSRPAGRPPTTWAASCPQSSR